MQKGWIAVNRSLVDHWLHQDKPFCRFGAWVDLLLMANHENRKLSVGGSLITIERGQLFTSSVSLSERWGWSRGKLERFLECLESDQMLTRKRTQNGQLLTLVNYGLYQDGGQRTDSKRTANGQRTDSKRTANGQRTDTNNNNNNENNDNNVNNENNETSVVSESPKGTPRRYFPNDDLLEKTFEDFRKMRIKIKKPMTDRAIELMLSRLEKLSTDPRQQAKILEQSIRQSWSGIYELHDDEPKNGQSKKPASMAEKWGLGGTA